MTLKEGEIIGGRYRLVSERGRGTFGEVWQAWDEFLEMEVALKIYIALDSRGIDEFKSEFRTTFSLNHPNLLHATHFDVIEKRPYLVMPYCPKSADELVGIMSEEEAWKFIKDVSAGLAYLHSKDVIHRDIKPDNILRDAQGDYLISDFGVSVKMRSTLRRNSVRDLSESSTQGTIGYMGPEMFTANPSAVKATDIWALGATVYELLEGELPFFGQGGVMQLHGGVIPDLRGNWPDNLKSTIAACLSKDTWERPKAEDLEWYAGDILAGRSVQLPWENAWKEQKEKEERLRQEAEQRRLMEERRAEEARQKVLVEERKRREEERLKAEAEKRHLEEEKRRQEEVARKAADDEKRFREEDKRRKEEERRLKEQTERDKKEAERKAREAEKAEQKAAAKAEKAKADKEKGKSKAWLWILLLAVAIGSGVWFYSQNEGKGGDPGDGNGSKPDTTVIEKDKKKEAEKKDEPVKEQIDSTSKEEQLTQVEEEVVHVSGLTLNRTELSLEEGKGAQLTATIHPVGADNKSVTWKSGNPSVATVSSRGYVSAKKAGTTTITVTTADGNKTAICTVTVKEKAPALEAAKVKDQVQTNWTEVKNKADTGDATACYEYANHCYLLGRDSKNGAEKVSLFKAAYNYAAKAVNNGDSRGNNIIRTLREKEQFDNI